MGETRIFWDIGCCPPVPLSSLNYALNETFGLGINVTIRGYSTSSLDRSKEFQTIGVPLTIYQSQSQKGDSNAEINLERIITCDIWAWFHDEAISDPNSLKSVVIISNNPTAYLYMVSALSARGSQCCLISNLEGFHSAQVINSTFWVLNWDLVLSGNARAQKSLHWEDRTISYTDHGDDYNSEEDDFDYLTPTSRPSSRALASTPPIRTHSNLRSPLQGSLLRPATSSSSLPIALSASAIDFSPTSSPMQLQKSFNSPKIISPTALPFQPKVVSPTAAPFQPRSAFDLNTSAVKIENTVTAESVASTSPLLDVDASFDFWAFPQEPLGPSPALDHFSNPSTPSFAENQSDLTTAYAGILQPWTTSVPGPALETLEPTPADTRIAIPILPSVHVPIQIESRPIAPVVPRVPVVRSTETEQVLPVKPVFSFASALAPKSKREILPGSINEISGAYSPLPVIRKVIPATISARPAPPARPPAVVPSFRPLINLLNRKKVGGEIRVLRSRVGEELKAAWHDIFSSMGDEVYDFKSYSLLAEKKGIVKLGGGGGAEWVALV